MNIDTEFYEPGPDVDNDDRAEMVSGLLHSFRRAHYFHKDESGEPTEPLSTVICDLIADLYHLADRISMEDDETEMLGAEAAHEQAMFHYAAEVEEERQEAEWEAEEA